MALGPLASPGEEKLAVEEIRVFLQLGQNGWLVGLSSGPALAMAPSSDPNPSPSELAALRLGQGNGGRGRGEPRELHPPPSSLDASCPGGSTKAVLSRLG